MKSSIANQQFTQELILNTSPEYVENNFKVYQSAPEQLNNSWRSYFLGLEHAEENIRARINSELELMELIYDFRIYGHRYANVSSIETNSENSDPYNLLKRLGKVNDSEVFQLTEYLGMSGKNTRELKNDLRKIYIDHVGVEYGHVSDPKIRSWIEEELNSEVHSSLDKEEKRNLLKLLLSATNFELFLQKKYQGKKRFSLEGAETIICALHELLNQASIVNTKEISLAMTHRGRLNVLANFLNWPLIELLSEFEEFSGEGESVGMGDVTYHLGHSNDLEIKNKKVHVSLAFNPSHLEYVYPVALGKTKAKIERRYDGDIHAILPVIIHGDAGVVGQGIVSETLNFSELPAYSVGGTIHFVINNMLGYTASVDETRSTEYCTDFAKAIEAPIFHVNGDDVESVIRYTKLAFKFRQQFNRDIFIDINCYRKHGHNEMDEPRYTNPLLYEKIDKQKPVHKLYEEKLLEEKYITKDFSKVFIESSNEHLESNLKIFRDRSLLPLKKKLTGDWMGLDSPNFSQMLSRIDTSVKNEIILEIVDLIHQIPKSIKVSDKLKRSLKIRYDKVKEKGLINWPLAELIAFGTLLKEGVNIRFVGQDSVRGTFSQRHASYFDQVTGKPYTPLKELNKNSSFEIFNSPLSENAAMGFEFGYSMSAPYTLTIWEAQFGDFYNAAQVIVDQFIAASEEKWKKMSGLVLLLPHGLEGQGPDHSSGRIERFLQLCSEGNIQVVQPSSAAQYFRLLRRQMLRSFRKPLIIFTPKSLLRSDLIASPLEEFEEGGFQNILTSKLSGSELRGIVCTGKVYWELYEQAKEVKILDRIFFIRIEQVYPLDVEELKKIVKSNEHIIDWFWVQEEPQNSGAWTFIKLNTLSLGWNLKYVGRPIMPVTAEGNMKKHKESQKRVIDKALKGLK